MYNVWNTIHPENVQAVFEYANSVRYAVDNEKMKENTILITEEWQRELEAMPFVSKVKGKMSALLKQKSKIMAERKDRVTYEAYDFTGKRPRDEGTVVTKPST